MFHDKFDASVLTETKVAVALDTNKNLSTSISREKRSLDTCIDSKDDKQDKIAVALQQIYGTTMSLDYAYCASTHVCACVRSVHFGEHECTATDAKVNIISTEHAFHFSIFIANNVHVCLFLLHHLVFYTW